MLNYIGIEFKVSFELDLVSYVLFVDEGDVFVVMFDLLSEFEFVEVYLSGESYLDVLVGLDNGSGMLLIDYFIGDNCKGIFVLSLM